MMISYLETILEPCINYLFDIDINTNKVRPIIHKEHKYILRDYLEAILIKLNENKNLDEKYDVESYIFILSEAVMNSSDHQIGAFKKIYNPLYFKKDISDLGSFIVNSIASNKEKIFNYINTLVYAGEKVTVSLKWKNKMRNKLGFDCEYKPIYSFDCQDPFLKSEVNLLDAF